MPVHISANVELKWNELAHPICGALSQRGLLHLSQHTSHDRRRPDCRLKLTASVLPLTDWISRPIGLVTGLLDDSRIRKLPDRQLADYSQLADWTTRGLDSSRTGQLADWTCRGMDNSRSGQLADWTTRGLDMSRNGQLADWTCRGMDNSRSGQLTD